jgi:hypothetical protein
MTTRADNLRDHAVRISGHAQALRDAAERYHDWPSSAQVAELAEHITVALVRLATVAETIDRREDHP